MPAGARQRSGRSGVSWRSVSLSEEVWRTLAMARASVERKPAAGVGQVIVPYIS